jgi:recombination DNA repair RAD52 pathway protein
LRLVFFSRASTAQHANNAGLNPNTSGVVWELDWSPFGKNWADQEKNLRLGLQYTTFNKFNGSAQGPSGNNSLYIYAWTAI